MVKKLVILKALLLVASFPLFSQSEIPTGADKYLQVICRTDIGGQDLINVVFFEVPDTITSTLYFAIKDPEGDGTIPDRGNFNYDTTYTLMGGPGTISHPNARKINHGLASVGGQTHLDGGNILSEYIYNYNVTGNYNAIQGENAEGNDDWVYFPGVSPSQGEHIGNKYYFKVVAESGEDTTVPIDDTFANAYKLDVSLINGTGVSPSGAPGVRAFAYSWMVCFDSNGAVNTWEIFPFVPDTATGDIVFHNYDLDSKETLTVYNIDNSFSQVIPSSGDNADLPASFPINPTASDRNGTWRLTVVESTAGIPMENTAEIWFTNSVSSEAYRAYSQAVPAPPAADHIAQDYEDGIAFADAGFTDSEVVTFQIVDSNDTPLPYVRTFDVLVSGNARINEVNGIPEGVPGNTASVTTDSMGLATIRIIDNTVEIVTVTITTGGYPGTHEIITIDFLGDINPTISSAQNLSFTEGNPRNLEVITVRDAGTANITGAGDIRIRIPDSLDAVFNTGLTGTLTVAGAGTGSVNGNVTYDVTEKIAIIDVVTDFAVTNTLTIAGLAFTNANTFSSGYLEASFDSGATYTATDDKFIMILSSTLTRIWDGSNNTAWNDPANWINNQMPTLDTDNVIIPNVSPAFMPTLNVAGEVINHLNIDPGATLTLGNNNFTASGNLTNDGTLVTGGFTMTVGEDVSGNGTLNSTGGGTITVGKDWDILTFIADTGTVVFNGITDSTFDSRGNSFNNIQINKTGATVTLGAAPDINGNLDINAGTLDVSLSNYQITIAGNWTGTGAFTPRGGTVLFNGSSTLQSAETFFNCTIDAASSLSLNGNNCTVTNTFDIVNTGTLFRTGGETGPTDTNSGLVVYQNLAGGTIQDYAATPGNDYFNLRIAGTGTFTINPGTELTIAGTLLVSGGTLSAAGAADTRARGNVTFSGTGTFTKGTGTFYLDGGTAKNLDPNTRDLGIMVIVNTVDNNVTLTGSGSTDAFTIAGANAQFNIAANQTLTTSNDTVTVTNGTLNLDTNASLTTGTGTITSTGTIVSRGAISCGIFNSTGVYNNLDVNTIQASGNVTLSGTFPGTAGNNTLTMTGNGTTINAGYAIGNFIADVSGAGGTITMANNLSIGGTGTIAGDTILATGANDFTITGTLTCPGTFDATGNGTITANGNVNFTGGGFQEGTGTFTFSGGGAQNLTPPQTAPDDDLGNVIITGDNTVVTLANNLVCSSLTLSNNLNVQLNTGNNDITINGLLDADGHLNAGAGNANITVFGDALFTNGSFTKGSGTFTFNGGSTKDLYGNSQDLGIVTIANTAGNVVVIQETMTMDTLTLAGPNARVDVQDITLYINDGESINNTGTLRITGVGTNATIISTGPGTYAFTGNDIDYNGLTVRLGRLNAYEPAVLLGLNERIIIMGNSTFNNTISLNGNNSQLAINPGITLTTTNDTITITNGTMTINAGSTVNTGTGNIVSGGTIASEGALLCNDFTSTGTYTNTAVNTITATGNVTFLAGTFGGTATDNTLTMTGNNSTIEAEYQIGNLLLDVSGAGGTVAITNRALDIGGTMNIAADTILNMASFDLTSRGTLTSPGTLNADQDETITAYGDVNFNTGTFERGTPAAGTVTFAGGTTKNFYPASHYFGSVTVNSIAGNNVIIHQSAIMDTFTIGANSMVDLNAAAQAVTLTINNGYSIDNSGILRIFDDTNIITLTSTPGNTFSFTGNDIDYNGNRIFLGRLNAYAPPVVLGPGEGIFINFNSTFTNTITLNSPSALVTIFTNVDVTVTDSTFTINTGILNIGPNSTLSTGTGDLVSSGTINNSGSIQCNVFSSTGTYTNAAVNTIEAGGNVTINGTFSAPVTDNTLTMTGAGTTIDTVPQIGTLIIDSSGNTISIINNDLSVANTLTVTPGTTFDTLTRNVTIAGDAIINGGLDYSGNGTLLDIGGNLTSAGAVTASGNGDITVTGNISITNGTFDTGAGDITVGGNFTLSNGTMTDNGAGAITVTGNMIFTGGNYNAADGDININGNINVAGAAGTYTTGTITMTGTAAQNITSGVYDFDALHISNITQEVTIQDDFALNSLIIDTGASLAVNGNGLTCPSATFQNNGTLYRRGTPGETAPADITVLTEFGRVVYRGAAGGTIQSYPGDDYRVLEIEGTGVFTLGGDVELVWDLVITGGTLNLNGQTLTLERDFLHNSTGTFTHGNGEIRIINNTKESRVTGINQFYNFTCTTPGKTIRFGPDPNPVTGDRQIITNGGTFTIQGLPGQEIYLREIDDGIPATTHWLIDARIGCTLILEYVEVYYSEAAPEPIIIPDNVNVYNCINWVQYAFVDTSWTEDTDNNGKIDRIGVSIMNNLSLNDDFDGLVIEIVGYELLAANEYITGSNANDNIFYFLIRENPSLDTDATPVWWISSTDHNLKDSLSNKKLVTSISEAEGGEVADDRAQPIIGYTLAAADKDEVFICFSEPIYRPTGTVITAANFTDHNGAPVQSRTRITSLGAGTEEVLLTLSANVTADEIYNQDAISMISFIDAAGNSLVSTTHRVSDLGLGVGDNGIIQPVWAQDETQWDQDSLTNGTPTLIFGFEPFRDQYISVFDGSAWLRDQEITLQAHIHELIPGPGLDISLHYDVNVPAGRLRNEMWLPPFDDTAYNGIVPLQNGAARELTVAPENIVSDQLRNFIISPDDSEVSSGAMVEFLFEIPSIQLYTARLENPDSPTWFRTVKPWSFKIQDIIEQDSHVTILNNVINPSLGEKTYLHFTLEKAGKVTIMVFDLKGDIVDIIMEGKRKSRGDHAVSWDGKNRGRRIVARGIYFIKITAPDISEIRKVLVVK